MFRDEGGGMGGKEERLSDVWDSPNAGNSEKLTWFFLLTFGPLIRYLASTSYIFLYAASSLILICVLYSGQLLSVDLC